MLVALSLLIVGLTWAMLYQVVKQQGRLLLRIERLERDRRGSDLPQTEALRPHLPGERPLADSRLERNGLKVGAPAPELPLRDLQGRDVSLQEYRGRNVLVVFTDPQCHPCDSVTAALADLNRQVRDDHVSLIVIGRGEIAANRQKAADYRLECRVVVQRSWEVSRAYGIFQVPAAFLIGENGTIAKAVARGSGEVIALAREVLATGGTS